MSGGVGLPGGPRRHHSANNRQRAADYRNSPEGRMARKMYLMQPEVKARMALRRKIKKSLGLL